MKRDYFLSNRSVSQAEAKRFDESKTVAGGILETKEAPKAYFETDLDKYKKSTVKVIKRRYVIQPN